MRKILIAYCFFVAIFISCQGKKTKKPISLPTIFESNQFTQKMEKENISEFEASGEATLLKHFLQPHFLVFDVGANAGKWSQLVLSYEPSCKIIAFEPAPEIYQRLANNKILRKKGASFYNFALSDTLGTANFYYYNKTKELSLLSGFYNRSSVNQDQDTKPSTISIEKETLDHFCHNQKINYIDFLKIDTEGAELAVLKGTTNLIENHQITAIQFEYGKAFLDSHATLKEIFFLLTKNDYIIFKLKSEGLVYLPDWEDSFEDYKFSNYFAILKKKFPGF